MALEHDSEYQRMRADARTARSLKKQLIKYEINGVLKTVVKVGVQQAIAAFAAEGYMHISTTNNGRVAEIVFVLDRIVAGTTLDKTCPRCAETVKLGAEVCRFCGHDFAAEADATKRVRDAPHHKHAYTPVLSNVGRLCIGSQMVSPTANTGRCPSCATTREAWRTPEGDWKLVDHFA